MAPKKQNGTNDQKSNGNESFMAAFDSELLSFKNKLRIVRKVGLRIKIGVAHKLCWQLNGLVAEMLPNISAITWK